MIRAGRDYQLVDPPAGSFVTNGPDHSRVQLMHEGMPVEGAYGWLKHPVTFDPYRFVESSDAMAPQRTMATHEFDRALGFGMVPETYLISTDLGPASLQQEVAGPAQGLAAYDPVDVDRMAALDYATGQLDRHDDNYRTTPDARPAGIDNDQCLYSTTDFAMMSDFVAARFGHQLAPEVIDGIAGLDRTALALRLSELGIHRDGIDAAFTRLDEMLGHGAIVGSSWAGSIIDGRFTVSKPPGVDLG